MKATALNTDKAKAGAKAPTACVSSTDEIYQALEAEVKNAGHDDIVRMLGRGSGSNMVRFACAVAAEALATGHRVVVADSELTLKEPKKQRNGGNGKQKTGEPDSELETEDIAEAEVVPV